MRPSILISSHLRTSTFCTAKPVIPNFRTIRKMSTGVPSETASAQSESKANAPSMSELGIENTNINTAQGVELDPRQKVLVGSVLDLFAGRPSLKKLQLWADDAEFNDPITHATGRKQYEPQWYGLVAAFSEIERLSHNVTSSGNPITMDMKTRYKVKGIGMEKVIESVIKIKYDEGTGKITEVQDRWNNEVPEGAFAKVSKGEVFDLFWWANYWMSWGWWAWGLIWWTTPWLAVRNLNSVTVPAFVSVPKNEEEDAKKSL